MSNHRTRKNTKGRKDGKARLDDPGAAVGPRALVLGRVVLGLVSLVMVVVLARVGQLQYAPDKPITQLLSSQRSETTLVGRRGSLVDRHGRTLAVTRVAKRLFVDPLLIEEPNLFSEKVGYLLDYDPAAIERRISEHPESRYIVIERRLNDARTALLEDVDLPGLATEPVLAREYPQGALAGQLVGFCNVDNVGIEGLESLFNGALAGKAGKMQYWRDARRRPLWIEQDGYAAPTDGRAVRLSIDATIQGIAERRLAEACTEYEAESGQLIMMQPFTGEILAMANWPKFDPRPGKESGGNADPALRRNRSVTDVFEPGSTFKPFMWAAATQMGLANPEEMIDAHDGLYVTSEGRRLRDDHEYHRLSWEMGLVKSSNIVMAIVGERMGAQRMHDAVRAFGFGRKTASGLPGEVGGIVNPLRTWTHYSVTSIPMGQEIAVTGLQLTRAFCIIANGGLVVSPTILARRGDDDVPIYERILSAHAATVTRRALRRVVTEGTGRRAAASPYAIFGKTGTAQVANPEGGGYLPGAYTATFVCGAPLNQPRVVVTAIIHKPKKAHYGGTVAAPLARDVVDQTLTYLGVSPSDDDARQLVSR